MATTLETKMKLSEQKGQMAIWELFTERES